MFCMSDADFVNTWHKARLFHVSESSVTEMILSKLTACTDFLCLPVLVHVRPNKTLIH